MADRRRLAWRCFMVVCLVLSVLAGSAARAQGEAAGNDPGSAAAGGGEANPNEESIQGVEPAAAEPALAAAGGPGYALIPAAAFSSDGYIPDGFRYNFAGGYLYATESGGVCLMAPVALVPGTTVNVLEATLNDSSATASESFELSRVDLRTGTRDSMAYVASPEGTTAGVVKFVDSTVDYGLVSNEYAYQITTCARVAIYFYGARVGYSAQVFMPEVIK